jgi:tripartite-type tricarboxylate transporter receptor subunit TctC
MRVFRKRSMNASRLTCALAFLELGLPLIEANRLRALGVTSPGRSPIAPQLSAIAEAGLPGSTPEAFVQFLGRETAKYTRVIEAAGIKGSP